MSYEYDDFEDFYGETMDDHYSDYDDAADENWWADKWEDEADEDDGYCDDEREDFHADEAIGYVDPFEDGPFLD